MQQATHIYSGAKGTIIGYHADRKAHLVKLPTGQNQLWRDNAINKEGELNMTIMFKLSSNKSHHPIIERYFNNAEDAHQYLAELKTLNDLSVSKDGLSASITNGWVINSNYDIKEILKNKSKSGGSSFDIRKALNTPIKLPSNHKPVSPDALQANPRLKKIASGKMVKLQDLTNDPRKARVILRNLVRNKKIVKPGRWEWEVGSADLETVKAALSK